MSASCQTRSTSRAVTFKDAIKIKTAFFMEFKRWEPRVGDWVEVKPAAEILETLDARGEMERMPFMPEMLVHAGKRFQISAVAHKTCDTVNKTGGRAVKDAVHLADLRCDGSAHGGCRAACLLFWKTAWLQPVSGQHEGTRLPLNATDRTAQEGVGALTSNASSKRADGAILYRCQATTLPEWSTPLHWWDARQYRRDVRSGNVTARRAFTTLILASIFNIRRLPRGYRFACWLYERAHLWLRGFPDPHGTGKIPQGRQTPDARLDLTIGELVEIKSRDEIFETVNFHNRNRGLQIDEEMTRYCGGRFRVVSRVTRIINERTGEMMHFNNPCIVLDNVNCLGEYSARRLLCPRRITAYWREIWLKRVEDGPAADPG